MKLSPIAEKLLSETNLEVIKMVASGKFPLPPNELIYVVSHYGIENIGNLKDECINTLKGLPESFYHNFLRAPDIPEKIILFLAYVFQNQSNILEVLFRHPSTPQKLFEMFSKHSNEIILRRLIEAESKWIDNQKVIENLLGNPNVPLDLIEKIKFYRKSDVESSKTIVDKIESHEEVVITEQDRKTYNEFIEERDIENDAEAKRSLSGKIAKLSVAEKIKLALMGNKEVRSILIKDSNKLVSTAVLKNPRITDGEIVKITQDKNVNEEIIRLICHNNNWTQNYAVKYNLVMHPKTPLPMALKFLTSLSIKDLGNVAKSKNVPAALATNARKLMTSRSK
ncbi:MAG: hypothetical protein N2202_05340 [Proteobacteria bacterium]|nr:hypothetical protein [Pseudomonadota bacterium]